MLGNALLRPLENRWRNSDGGFVYLVYQTRDLYECNTYPKDLSSKKGLSSGCRTSTYLDT